MSSSPHDRAGSRAMRCEPMMAPTSMIMSWAAEVASTVHQLGPCCELSVGLPIKGPDGGPSSCLSISLRRGWKRAGSKQMVERQDSAHRVSSICRSRSMAICDGVIGFSGEFSSSDCHTDRLEYLSGGRTAAVAPGVRRQCVCAIPQRAPPSRRC